MPYIKNTVNLIKVAKIDPPHDISTFNLNPNDLLTRPSATIILVLSTEFNLLMTGNKEAEKAPS